MSAETLFALAFPVAVPFWFLMIFLPGWSWTHRIMSSPLIVVPPLLVHLALLIPNFAVYAPPVVSADLPGLVAVLGTPVGAATVWAHAIGFDLFVGRWMYLDSRERGIHPLIMGPLFVLTILLSPIGLLTYLALRLAVLRRHRRGHARQESGDAQPAAAG